MTPCMIWPSRSRNGKGYATVRDRREEGTGHRLVWESAYGPIPEGLFVLHHCDNPPCFRLDHLFLGTKGDNNRDMFAKKRDRWSRRKESDAADRTRA